MQHLLQVVPLLAVDSRRRRGPNTDIDEPPQRQVGWGTDGGWGAGDWGAGDWGAGDWGSTGRRESHWDPESDVQDVGDWGSGAATGLESSYRIEVFQTDPIFIPKQTSSSSLSSYPYQHRTRPRGAARRPERTPDRQLAAARTVRGVPQRAQSVSTHGYVRIDDSLAVSLNVVLGNGSGGTRVFKGLFKGRVVAVKRMLSHLLIERELETLQQSDSHPNIIRYFYHTNDVYFQYIALELCPASLADIIERPNQPEFHNIAAVFEPTRALHQITAGLHHLHALRIVHRDIKPQNILISDARGGYRMLVSDFGLCKQLEDGRTSYNPTAPGAGTVGWRAPEVLRGQVKLDSHSVDVTGGGPSLASASSTWSLTRQTQMVDIFALGCLYYYVQMGGSHPFGAGVEVESNILKNAHTVEGLRDTVAIDLILRMLSPRAENRPDTTVCLLHPFLWDADKRLAFLQEASDRLQNISNALLAELESSGQQVVGEYGDWLAELHPEFVAHFWRRRKYNGRSVQDLLRIVRNASHHRNELPDDVKTQLGESSQSLLDYFTDKFPRLFLHVYDVVSSSAIRIEPTFRRYF